MFVYDYSDVFGSGDTTYARNSGLYGGAIFVTDNATMSWSGETVFSSNTTAKTGDGGAIHVYRSSQAFWSEKTFFENNSATQSGGGHFCEL